MLSAMSVESLSAINGMRRRRVREVDASYVLPLTGLQFVGMY